MTLGFFGGLLVDLAPPADHVAGRWALALVVAGYLAGRVRQDAGSSALASVATVAATLLRGDQSSSRSVGMVLGDDSVSVGRGAAGHPDHRRLRRAAHPVRAAAGDAAVPAHRAARGPFRMSRPDHHADPAQRAGSRGASRAEHAARSAPTRRAGCGWSCCRCWCSRCSRRCSAGCGTSRSSAATATRPRRLTSRCARSSSSRHAA